MIVGKIVYLRAMDRDDLALVVQWRNSPEVYNHLIEREPISMSRQIRWFEGLMNRDNVYSYIICTHSDKPIGVISLDPIDWRNRNAEWGFYLAEVSYRGRGHGVEAEYLLLKHAFLHLNLERLYCKVLANHHDVIALHQRFNFQREGTLRRHVYCDGGYQDLMLMGLMRDEFLEVVNQIEEVIEKVASRINKEV